MQIKTALAIGSGIAVGVVIGMCISEDTKCKIFGKIRKKLIYALGGEEKKTKNDFKKPISYAAYYNTQKVNKKPVQEEQDTKTNNKFIDSADKSLFEISGSYDEIIRMWNNIKNHVSTFGSISINDIHQIENNILGNDNTIGYEWDKYGYYPDDLPSIRLADALDYVDLSHACKIVFPKPRKLK